MKTQQTLQKKSNETLYSKQELFCELIDALVRPPMTKPPKRSYQLIEIAKAHHLQGLLYSRFKEKSEVIALSLEKEWMFQRWVTLLHLEELARVENALSEINITCVRLKGASILSRLYHDPGDRILSDVDILVKKDQEKAVHHTLKKFGYSYRPTLVWDGSRNRTNWVRQHPSGIELSIDVHTALYWKQPQGLESKIVKDEQGFWRLDDESELLHLIVNWVEQDTCVSLNKLFDIYLYIERLNRNATPVDWPINWNAWFLWATKLGHWRSIRMVEWMLKKVFALTWGLPEIAKHRRYKKMVQWTMAEPQLFSFLLHPQKNRIKYYLIKHMTRSPQKALNYDLLWGRARVSRWINKLVDANSVL